MSLRDFVKAKKTLIDAGAWTDKRMPKTGGKFPLSRARSFRVGAAGWRWRVVQLEAGGRHYRLLCLLHAGKCNFVAILATPVGTDLLVLGALENHGSHPGWHVHASCKTPEAGLSGRLRYDGMKRAAAGAYANEATPFPSSDDEADAVLVRYFRLPSLGGGLGLQLNMLLPQGGVQ